MNRVTELIMEYDEALDEAIGLYLDAQAAMVTYSEHIEKIQQKSCLDMGLTMVEIDERQYCYGRGDPNSSASIYLHGTTQRELKARNKSGGRNHIVLGQRFIVDTYTYWEDGYRPRIADAAKIEKNKLTADVFGDIRIIRNDIIHHRGIATNRIKGCKILKWYSEGDLISISEDQFETLITEVRAALEQISQQYAGSPLGFMSRFGSTGHKRI